MHYKVVTQEESVNSALKRVKEHRESDWGLSGYDCGIHPLNMKIGGWVPGKLTTIAGRSGMGKTALTVPMYDSSTRVLNGKRTEYLVFSWEMESSYLVDRHVCYKTGLTLRHLSQGIKLMSDWQLKKVYDVYEDAKTLNVYYEMMPLSLEMLLDLSYKFVEGCKRRSKEQGIEILPVIVVDYVGLAKFPGSNVRTYEIGDFINGIKLFNNDTMSASCILAQISRGADDKEMPTRRDIADSQSIEMASDNLVILHRPEYTGVKIIKDPETGEEFSSKNKAILRVLKSRDFGTGDYIINCEIPFYRFYDGAFTWDFPYWELYSEKDFWVKELGLNRL